MSARFLNQANLPGFLPFMEPNLLHKPCTGVEGACGTGGRAIATGMRSILSDLANSVFVAAFEMQNTMRSVYGADVLAGAAYYKGERKEGHAYFFPPSLPNGQAPITRNMAMNIAAKGWQNGMSWPFSTPAKTRKRKSLTTASQTCFRWG